jgi:hypothetical protein
VYILIHKEEEAMGNKVTGYCEDWYKELALVELEKKRNFDYGMESNFAGSGANAATS